VGRDDDGATFPTGRYDVVTLAVTVREAKERDLESFEALWTGPHVRWCREEFARSDAVILVAVDHDELVGKVHVEFGSEGIARIQAAIVVPELRGRGVGTRLLDAAERLARESVATAVELGVEDSNPPARRLYERLGYRVVGTDDFRYDGAPVPNPGVWMRKDLL
jgi:ribosomal protein S18 acetylase RimI-like enzyme